MISSRNRSLHNKPNISEATQTYVLDLSRMSREFRYRFYANPSILVVISWSKRNLLNLILSGVIYYYCCCFAEEVETTCFDAGTGRTRVPGRTWRDA